MGNNCLLWIPQAPEAHRSREKAGILTPKALLYKPGSDVSNGHCGCSCNVRDRIGIHANDKAADNKAPEPGIAPAVGVAVAAVDGEKENRSSYENAPDPTRTIPAWCTRAPHAIA